MAVMAPATGMGLNTTELTLPTALPTLPVPLYVEQDIDDVGSAVSQAYSHPPVEQCTGEDDGQPETM
jgi:hypothetical protein